jgi:hypothetical protein
MKILPSSFLFLTAFTLNLILHAQAPSIVWKKCLGGSSDDNATSILQTSDGGYIVAGSSASTNGDVSGNHGSYDVLWCRSSQAR